MKKSRNEPLNGEERKTDETGMETLSGMVAWQEMGVPLPIIKALKDLGFTSPTAIQQQAIPVAMDTTSDIIGAAETVRTLLVKLSCIFYKGQAGYTIFHIPTNSANISPVRVSSYGISVIDSILLLGIG